MKPVNNLLSYLRDVSISVCFVTMATFFIIATMIFIKNYWDKPEPIQYNFPAESYVKYENVTPEE